MKAESKKRKNEVVGEVIKVRRGGKRREETDEETENGEKAEVGGGEDGTEETREMEDRWR